MDELVKFIPEQLFILVAALNILGMFMKSNDKIKDYLIPWILLVVGIVFSVLIDDLNATSVLQGIICTGVAVLGNQLIKQVQKKD